MWTFDYLIAIFFIIGAVVGIIGLSVMLTALHEKRAMKKWTKKHSPVKQTKLYKELRGRDE